MHCIGHKNKTLLPKTQPKTVDRINISRNIA